jgi:hypothetical protein
LIGGSTGSKICPELGLGNMSIPTASAEPTMNRAQESDRCTFIWLIHLSWGV